MAIAFDAVASGVATGFAVGPRTISYSHTVTGTNPLLVAWIAIFQDVANTGTVSAISYNSVSLTNCVAPVNSVNMEGEMDYLAAPATGAHTYSVTVTGATDGIRTATGSFTGVAQTSPLGVTNTSTGSSGNPAISITTGTANSVSVSGLSRFSNTAITASTFTNMVRANANNVTMTFNYNLNTTATTYTDTETGTAAQDWVMGIAEFMPANSAVNATVAQVAASLTFTGGTQSVATVNVAIISQSAASLTLTGGTQAVASVRKASIPQVAASLTFTGGTQAVSTIRIAAIAQAAASLSLTGGTQTVSAITVSSVSISQTAATLTFTGGTQVITATRKVAISQAAANLTFTGGTQSVASARIAIVTQVAANLIFTGGAQAVAVHGNTNSGFFLLMM